MDWIPFISQAKSLVQASLGDVEGARITQENFSRECPGISQVRSAVEAIGGNEEAARQTQMIVRNLDDFVDSVPVVGHTKGAIHYMCGDNEEGAKAMKAASRTTSVIAAATGGFLVAGPVGAVVGGMAGGAAMDGIITGVDSAIQHKYVPHGIVANAERLKENPADVEQWLDTIASPVFDGLVGYETTTGRAGYKRCTRENGTVDRPSIREDLKSCDERYTCKTIQPDDIHCSNGPPMDGISTCECSQRNEKP